MPKESLAAVTRRRGFGVLYLVLIGALLWVSIAIYQKKFTDVVIVSLKTDHTGNELQPDSDVKERGIIVGAVRAVHVSSGANGGCTTATRMCVTVDLALDPAKVPEIPRNVSARILPKTIFGEQYVALQVPTDRGPAIAAGDVITQDRSRGALEAQQVLGDLLPLLQAVRPAELNATLTAVAQALQGRGTELGHTLVGLDKYLTKLNPHTPQLVEDLVKLGKVANEYADVSPDLFATLDNLQTSAHTIIGRSRQLTDLLTTATDTSGVLRSFLADNASRLITVTDTSKQIYGLLAEYSPEYPCLFAGLAKVAKLSETYLQNRQFQLSIVADANNQGGYKPGEQPRYVTGYGPDCLGLPDNPTPQQYGHFAIPAKYRCLNDGAALTDDPCAQRKADGESASRIEQSGVESQSENAMVNAIVSRTYGTSPDKVQGIATILAAPMLRGHQVDVP